MKISLDWLQDFVELPKDLSPRDFSEIITKHTAEVEEVVNIEEEYKNMVLGKIKAIRPHPDADKLRITDVDCGDATYQIVCGGSNLEEGMKVAIALPGAVVKWHGTDVVELKETAIRGQDSYGMICAGEEIGLGEMQAHQTDDPNAILVLNHVDAPAGTPLAEALGMKGLLLDIDNKSLTHRPDLWGHYGFAREASAIWGKPLRMLDEFLYDGPEGSDASMKVTIERDDICPRFTHCIVTGIEIGPSPQWMQARLELAGMNPINNIVDITNYVMLELGQPMHAYDRAQVGSDEMIVGAGRPDVKLVTLDGEERDLHEEDPTIYNATGTPLTIAGIKGGEKSGIHENTTEIILEAANWDAIMIRKASVRHQLRTDASQRFEKRLDPAMTDIAVRRALKLILAICPNAELISPIQTEGSWSLPDLKITVQPDRVRSKIGLEIPTETMVHILTALDFGVQNNGDTLLVEVPSHRATSDVDIEEDIVEEIARIHGYDKIPAVLPKLPAKLPEPNDERFFKHRTRELMAFQLGFTEVLNYSFYGMDRLQACDLNEEEHVRVLNYLSEDQTHMRTAMTPNILGTIARNQKEFEHIKVFEFGRTYKEIGEYMPLEEKHLIMAIGQKDEPFYAAKGALEDYFEAFGLSGVKFKASQTPPPYAHPKKCVDVIVRGQTVGHVFTAHPGTIKSYDIDIQVGIVELNFSKLMSRGLDKAKFQEPAKFPGMSFDLSLLVDARAEAGSLASQIQKAHKLIESVELFDIYTGKGIDDDKKSLSYKIDLRHKDRTLTDDEFKAVQKAVMDATAKAGAEVRGA